MDTDKPILSKKKVLVGTAVLLVLMGAAAVFLLYKGPSQNIPDDQEPQLDFVAEGSKLAGVQVLVQDGGLSRAQYEAVCEQLGEKLAGLEPSAQYFVYVEDSLRRSSVEEDEPHGEELEDGTVVYEYVDRDEPEEAASDALTVELRSDSGAEYMAEIYIEDFLASARVEVTKK